MKNIQNTNTGLNTNNGAETVEVLYQKMGDRWFAFSLIDNEVFVGSITQEEIDTLEASGNSGKTAVKMPSA